MDLFKGKKKKKDSTKLTRISILHKILEGSGNYLYVHSRSGDMTKWIINVAEGCEAYKNLLINYITSIAPLD
jgi:hypothetical protein